tara:strand:+ start:3459 stop:4112 length:654 start_codon:yes stop_codon:yes gene_type:complete
MQDTVPSNGVFAAARMMSTVETWTSRTEMLDDSHKELLTGGSLSKRFSNLPLWLSHPANICGFYGSLVSLALILPFMMTNPDSWGAKWVLTASVLIVACMILGMMSRIISSLTGRMPVATMRKLLYPMPFLGLGLFTVNATELLSMPDYIPYTLLMLPGPLYVHLSWAPRWRLLCMVEDEINPFEGVEISQRAEDVSEVAGDDTEIIEVVEQFDSEE